MLESESDEEMKGALRARLIRALGNKLASLIPGKLFFRNIEFFAIVWPGQKSWFPSIVNYFSFGKVEI